MNRSDVLGDVMTVLLRAKDYIQLAEMFDKTPLMLPIAIVEEYKEIVGRYSTFLNREIADVMACMSLIMFGSLFLNDLSQSPLKNADFGPERRTDVDYFRNKRNTYIAHRNRVDAIELPFVNAEIRRGEDIIETIPEGRFVLSHFPAQYFDEKERAKFLSLLEYTIDMLGKKWDEAYRSRKGGSTDSCP